MYDFYALYKAGNPIDRCSGLARYSVENLFERFLPLKNAWIEDKSLFGVFCGEVEANRITESEAIIIQKELLS